MTSSATSSGSSSATSRLIENLFGCSDIRATIANKTTIAVFSIGAHSSFTRQAPMMCNKQFGHVAGRKLTGARQGNEEIVNFVALNLITGKFGDRLSPNISKGRRKNNAFSLGKLPHIDCRWIPTLLPSLLYRKSSLVCHYQTGCFGRRSDGPAALTIATPQIYNQKNISVIPREDHLVRLSFRILPSI